MKQNKEKLEQRAREQRQAELLEYNRVNKMKSDYR